MTTRYGGGFVQSIDGIEGSAPTGTRTGSGSSTASPETGPRPSYRLRDGDVAWWDYRDWSGDAGTLEVVAGAFPEPFLHGYDGKAQACGGPVRARPARRAPAASPAPSGRRRRARRSLPSPHGANVFELVSGAPHLTRSCARPERGPSGAVRFSFAGAVDALLGGAFARRFSSPVSAGPATALLAAAAAAAFLTEPVWALAAMTVVLLVICLRAPAQRRWLVPRRCALERSRRVPDLAAYVVFGRRHAALGRPDAAGDRAARHLHRRDPDRRRQRAPAGRRRAGLRAYTLLVDHDRLVSAAGFARRSALAVALATRLVPSLERDAAGFSRVRAGQRHRASGVHGLRDAALASRRRLARAGAGLAEAMEARGFGRSGARGRRARLDRGSTGWRSLRASLLVGVAARGSLAQVERLSFAYPGGAPGAARRLPRARARARCVALLGPSGSASRRFCGRLRGSCRISTGVASRAGSRSPVSTRGRHVPADLAGAVASVFQDPEDQVVMARVENEVAFGLENVGVPPARSGRASQAALATVGARSERATHRRALGRGAAARLPRLGTRTRAAAAPARRADIPARPRRGDGVSRRLAGLGCAAVLSEHRIDRALSLADTGLHHRRGTDPARRAEWRTPAPGSQRTGRATPVTVSAALPSGCRRGERLSSTTSASRTRTATRTVLEEVSLHDPTRRGGGTRGIERLRARRRSRSSLPGLLEPDSGTAAAPGGRAYLSQDPGRYLIKESALDEVALGVAGDRARARSSACAVRALGWAAEPSSARSLERGARAPRSGGDRRDRAGSACARRADARRRSRPEGGDR